MKTRPLFSAFLIVSVIFSFCGFAFADDTFPPTPNPAQWAVTPHYTTDGMFYYVSMAAVTATDDSPPIYYLFDCVSNDVMDSGWQISPTFTNGPLVAQPYDVYRIFTKDGLGNVSAPSQQYDTFGNPVPEPATICLLAIAGLMLRRK
jgi:hypothetical protein